MKTIDIEAVEVTPQTVVTGGRYLIRVKVNYLGIPFRFPLIIPKLLGIIFKKR